MKNRFKNLIMLPLIICTSAFNLNAQTTVTPIPQNSSSNPNNRITDPNSTTNNPNGNYQPVTAQPGNTRGINDTIHEVTDQNGNILKGTYVPSDVPPNSTPTPNVTNPNSTTNPTGIYPDGTTNQNGNIVPIHRLPVDAGGTNRDIQNDMLRKNVIKKYTEPNRKDSIAQPERLSPPSPERMRRDTLK